MSTPAQKIDATDFDHQIKAYEENIARAEKNIQIFTDEVQKQTQLKTLLTEELQKLKTTAAKNG